MRININNCEGINKAVSLVQKRCTVRTVDSLLIMKIADRAERRLSLISKKNRKGVEVYYYEGIGCNAYKYKGGTTMIILERGKEHWFLINVSRIYIHPSNNGMKAIALSPRARQALHRNIEKEYSKL